MNYAVKYNIIDNTFIRETSKLVLNDITLAVGSYIALTDTNCLTQFGQLKIAYIMLKKLSIIA